MQSKTGAVYIISNKNRTVFYIGVTSDIQLRMYQHKNGVYEGFSKKYQCHDLLYIEMFQSIVDAIRREKQMKKWNREWKLELIKKENPEMKDLSADWFYENGELKEMN